MAENGLGPHRRSHGVTSSTPKQAAPRSTRKADAALLAELLPSSTDRGLLQRLAGFVCHADIGRGLVLIGRTYGPQLVARSNVGGIIAFTAREPCIVLDVAQFTEAREIACRRLAAMPAEAAS